MKLKGKTAIITGASGGIGSAIVKCFVKEGCTVVIADIDKVRMQQLSDEINQKYGKVTFPVYMDVSDEASIQKGFDESLAHLKKLDILISNAGIQHLAPIVDFAYKDWQKIIKICLDGCFLTAKRAMQEMKKNGGGSIIFTGSLRSKIGGSQNSAYVAAKHGVLGLNRVVATEGALHKIRSNVLCPDYILTPMVEAQITQIMQEKKMSREDVIGKILLKDTVDHQFTTVEDVAETALFFASFPSNALTGQSLLISHGWGME